jgi:hypothetical protein
MIYVLVTGGLFRDSETKISKNGKPYVVATILSKDGESSTFANVVAFSDPGKVQSSRSEPETPSACRVKPLSECTRKTVNIGRAFP